MGTKRIEIKLSEEDQELFKQLVMLSQLWSDGKKAEAVFLLASLIQKNPDSPRLHETYAEYQYERGFKQEAFEHAEKAISLDPDNANPYITMAGLIAGEGALDEAFSQIESSFDKKVNIYLTFLSAADVYKKYGLLEKAKGIYERGIGFSPKSIDIWKSYSKMYIDTLQLEDALEVLKRGVEANPDDKELLLELTILAGGLSKKEITIPVIDRYEKLEPKDIDHFISLSRMYLANNDVDSSEKCIQEAIKMNKKDQRCYVQLAEIMKFRDNKKEIEKAYKEAEKIDKSKKKLIDMIKTLPPSRSRDVDRRDNAFIIFRKALDALGTNDQQTYVTNLGLALRAGGSVWLLESLLSVVKDDESRIGMLTMASMLFDAFGNKHDSIGAMYRATRLMPDNAEVWRNYAVALVKSDAIRGAIPAIEKARELDPNMKGINSMYGALLLKGGRYEEAIKHLHDAHIEEPNEVQILVYLIAGNIELKKFQEASDYIQKALTLDKKNPYLYGYLAQIENHFGRADNVKKALKECSKLNKELAQQMEKEIKQGK